MSDLKKTNRDSIDDKLFSLKYKADSESHLTPTPSDCNKCKEKPCNYFCPANVYLWDNVQSKLLVRFENCIECGACKIGCTYQSIGWRYPKAGYGVTFKRG